MSLPDPEVPVFDQVLKLVDQLSPAQVIALRRKLENKTWGIELAVAACDHRLRTCKQKFGIANSGELGLKLFATIRGAGCKLFENGRKLYATGLQSSGCRRKLSANGESATRSRKRTFGRQDGFWTPVFGRPHPFSPKTRAKNSADGRDHLVEIPTANLSWLRS